MRPREPSTWLFCYCVLVPAIGAASDDPVRDPFEVVVEAVRPQLSAASDTTILQEDFQALPLRTAEDVLRLVPGLQMVQHGAEGKGQQIFLRGFDAAHGADFAVSLDGVPVNEWSNIHGQGYLDLAFIIPEVVSQVEVKKGPYALELGAFAMAGAADYQLGIPRTQRGLRITYEAGSTQRHRVVATIAPEEGNGQNFSALEVLHDDGFGSRRRSQRVASLSRWTLWQSDNAGQLVATLALQAGRFELPSLLRADDVAQGRIGILDSYNPHGYGQSIRGHGIVKYRFKSTKHNVEILAHGGYRHLELLENFTGYFQDGLSGDSTLQAQDVWSYGARAQYRFKLSAPLSLRVHAGAYGDTLWQRERHHGRDTEPLATRRELDVHQLTTYLAAGVHWEPTGRLHLQAGVRADSAVLWVAHSDANDSAHNNIGRGFGFTPSPRLSLRWRAVDSVTLFSSYGQGFRLPEAAAVPRNTLRYAPLPMTQGHALEAGARWHGASVVAVRLAGFATFLQREAIFDHFSGRMVEGDATRRVGAEAVLEAHPYAWLRLQADASFVDARLVQTNAMVPLAPRWMGGLQAVAHHGSGWEGALRFLAIAPRPLGMGAQSSAYATADAQVGYRWSQFFISLQAENLFGLARRQGEFLYASHWPQFATEGAARSAIPRVHLAAAAPFNVRFLVGAQL